ncbi:uncharacterized protein MEPE_05013 [Melanopsichium pennsylvanicum]|uniref:Uncharacterized protein n=1 Tax=Melanopsichium pennsylvanicum TaxID=63383 RepID=A0AAJ4XNQ2_9BASI|nr:uncharacterized protein MEPE_05013 [Melanopsichium pennsylvanicum]
MVVGASACRRRRYCLLRATDLCVVDPCLHPHPLLIVQIQLHGGDTIVDRQLQNGTLQLCLVPDSRTGLRQIAKCLVTPSKRGLPAAESQILAQSQVSIAYVQP